ncbi:MAG: hypothetical protein ACXU87_26345 [Xanthobacteraceae bacterium]
MLKYITKFAMDILPSVVATIIGAYIVNHYIAAKPDAPAAAAAVVSSADPKQTDVKTDPKTTAKASVSVVGGLPQPGVTAKGISEKALIEQTAAEKPAVVEKSVAAEKPVEKSVDKPAETASIPADTRRHAPAPREREKVIAKSVTAPVAPSTPAAAAAPVAAAPIVAAPAAAPAAEAATAPEEHRDANELARAAIERLRGDGSPHPQEAARVAETPRIVSAPPVAPPVVSTPAVRPLPPPIMVSTPAAESVNAPTGSTQVAPSGHEDSRRPVPPADIPEASPSFSLPSPGPLDLRAEAGEPQRREHTNVAEDMLLAAKSVFHAVLPK